MSTIRSPTEYPIIIDGAMNEAGVNIIAQNNEPIGADNRQGHSTHSVPAKSRFSLSGLFGGGSTSSAAAGQPFLAVGRRRSSINAPNGVPLKTNKGSSAAKNSASTNDSRDSSTSVAEIDETDTATTVKAATPKAVSPEFQPGSMVGRQNNLILEVSQHLPASAKPSLSSSSKPRVKQLKVASALPNENPPPPPPSTTNQVTTSFKANEGHCFLLDESDLERMEDGLMHLLQSFNMGTLDAFAETDTFVQMKGIREKQERLTKMHFDLYADQQRHLQNDEKIQNLAAANLQQLTGQLNELNGAIQKLCTKSSLGDSVNIQSKNQF